MIVVVALYFSIKSSEISLEKLSPPYLNVLVLGIPINLEKVVQAVHSSC